MQEMKGLAKGTGLPLDQVVATNMVPEIIQLSCSMMGAWGKATEESQDGALVQLRALDFTANGFL
jgi:hypothetical protein